MSRFRWAGQCPDLGGLGRCPDLDGLGRCRDLGRLGFGFKRAGGGSRFTWPVAGVRIWVGWGGVQI